MISVCVFFISIKLNSNLQHWSGCWVSSLLCHNRFEPDCSLRLRWSCPHRSLPVSPCMSGLTQLSSDSAPFYCWRAQKKRAMRECEDVLNVNHKGSAVETVYIRKLYWLSKAVGSSDNPMRWHQRASADMAASNLQANLPGPVLNESICTPNNTVLRGHLSTVWKKQRFLVIFKEHFLLPFSLVFADLPILIPLFKQ